MADVVTREKRSEMMSGIRGKDTKPEMVIRKGLHGLGFRYRLHDRRLPGRPDLVFPKYRAVIFVNGCFWHAHGCSLFKWPSTNTEFWREKISGNAERDRRNVAALLEAGWRVLVVWECSFRGVHSGPREIILAGIGAWLVGSNDLSEISESTNAGETPNAPAA